MQPKGLDRRGSQLPKLLPPSLLHELPGPSQPAAGHPAGQGHLCLWLVGGGQGAAAVPSLARGSAALAWLQERVEKSPAVLCQPCSQQGAGNQPASRSQQAARCRVSPPLPPASQRVSCTSRLLIKGILVCLNSVLMSAGASKVKGIHSVAPRISPSWSMLTEVLGVYNLSGLVEGGEEGLKPSCSVYKG